MIENDNEYNRKSIRLKDFDYTSAGYYYITVCTQNKTDLFGEIVQDKPVLNDTGKLVENELTEELLIKYPNILIDTLIIMPNHIHFILLINENTGEDTSPGPTLGNIIGYFKYMTTKRINEMNNTQKIRVWQRNYYEHIIRNESDLLRIRQYIENNPIAWTQKHHPNRK